MSSGHRAGGRRQRLGSGNCRYVVQQHRKVRPSYLSRIAGTEISCYWTRCGVEFPAIPTGVAVQWLISRVTRLSNPNSPEELRAKSVSPGRALLVSRDAFGPGSWPVLLISALLGL